MPVCVRCNQDLPESRFAKSKHKLANGEYKTYTNKKTCMVCYRQGWLAKDEKNRETHRKGNRSWYHNNPALAKEQRLRKYGINLEQYNDLRKQQNYCCAVCKRHETEVEQGRAKTTDTALHVDHCHTSGKVRGLLCTNCNTMLGKSKDNVEVLQSAINYLEQHKGNL